MSTEVEVKRINDLNVGIWQLDLEQRKEKGTEKDCRKKREREKSASQVEGG